MKRSAFAPRTSRLITRTGLTRGKGLRARQSRALPPGTTIALFTRQQGRCPVCARDLDNGEPLDRHHRKLRSQGGGDEIENLLLLHTDCHTAGPEAVHRNITRSLALGHLVGRDREPALVPVTYTGALA